MELKTLCNPKQCPVPHLCPHASNNNTLCQVEEDFMAEVKKWTSEQPESPVTTFKVRALLMPLFKQYLWLRLSQEKSEHISITREIRATVKAMDMIINSITARKS